MATKTRDAWAPVEGLIETLRARRSAVKAEALALKTDFEARYQAKIDEHAALKHEIESLEQILEMHRARVPATPQIRALPSPNGGGTASPARSQRRADDPNSIRNHIKTWAREHDGTLVLAALRDHLIDVGRCRDKDQASSQITAVLAQIRTGFERVSRGVYRFYSIDGQALQAIDDEAQPVAVSA